MAWSSWSCVVPKILNDGSTEAAHDTKPDCFDASAPKRREVKAVLQPVQPGHADGHDALHHFSIRTKSCDLLWHMDGGELAVA